MYIIYIYTVYIYIFCTYNRNVTKVTPQRPTRVLYQLEISLSAGKVFSCDRYVFVLLGSVWCRECPRRALKSTIQGPKCQNTSPQPFRATKPSDSTKMASIAFFCAPVGVLQMTTFNPCVHLTGLWIPLPEKPDAKNNTLCRATFAAGFGECFFDFIWATVLNLMLTSVPEKTFWKRIILKCFWLHRAATTGTYEAEKAQSYLFIWILEYSLCLYPGRVLRD